MRTLIWVTVIAVLAGFSSEAAAQRRRDPNAHRTMLPERVEKFRKMRLIETLKLSEEASIRFFAKQSSHEDAVHELMQERDAVLDAIDQQMTDGKPDDKDLQRQSDKAMELDAKIFAERQRFQRDVRDLLTAEQFAKFIVFERDFGRQVRGALQEMREQRPRRDREE